MLALTLAAIAILACSCVLGQGLRALAGEETWAWWGPGAGFGLLLAISGICIRLPGHATTTAIAIAIAVLLSLVPRSARRALGTVFPDGVVVAAIVLAAWLIPFLVWRRTGIIGEGINNDSAGHLATAWWLEHHRGPAPVSAPALTATGLHIGHIPLVGYPVGPHGLIAALAVRGISLEHAFAGLLIAVPALTAIVALGGLPEARTALRRGAAVLVGLCYLALSFEAQAGFKEMSEALLVLTVAVGAAELVRRERLGWRMALPLGVAIGAPVYVFSYTGPVWTVAVAGAVALASGRFRATLRAAPGVLAAAIVVAAPAIGQMIKFADSAFSNENGHGNLAHALSPFELLGAWFNYDFRWTPDPLWPTIIGSAVVTVAAVIAFVRLIQARRFLLLAALLPVVVIYVYTSSTKDLYLGAKAMSIAAPLVMLTIWSGLLLPTVRGWRPVVTVVGALAAVAMITASFLALRDVRVGPVAHRHQLAELRNHMGSGRVLVMTKDDMNEWNLVGLDAYQPRSFYAPLVAHPDTLRPKATSGFYDFDNFRPKTLDKFRYAITTNTPYQSAAPPNWRPLARTRSFVLWRRHGRTPERYPTDLGTTPGRVLQCHSALGRLRLGIPDAHALVLPTPVVGEQSHWDGQPANAGQSGTMNLQVPRGRWDVSLQYAGVSGMKVRAPGLQASLPPTIARIGPFYYVGTVTQPRSGPMRFTVTANKLGTVGRLLGTRGHTRALDSIHNLPLGNLALTRYGAQGRLVPARRACGHYVDHVVRGAPPG